MTVHEDDRTLTAEFTGYRTTGPCGADYTARAVESAHAALIVVEEHPHERGASWDCPDVGYLRQVIVRLGRPLGDRAVLEAMRGLPVPVDPRFRRPYGAAERAPVDGRDVAAVIARTLSEGGHAGGDYVLTGPESLTQAEQIRIIGDTPSFTGNFTR